MNERRKKGSDSVARLATSGTRKRLKTLNLEPRKNYSQGLEKGKNDMTLGRASTDQWCTSDLERLNIAWAYVGGSTCLAWHQARTNPHDTHDIKFETHETPMAPTKPTSKLKGATTTHFVDRQGVEMAFPKVGRCDRNSHPFVVTTSLLGDIITS